MASFNSIPRGDIAFEVNGVEFHARGSVPGALVFDLLDGYKLPGWRVNDFLRLALREDEYERFARFIRDPDNGVDLAVLSDVIAWLVEQYLATPSIPALSVVDASANEVT